MRVQDFLECLSARHKATKNRTMLLPLSQLFRWVGSRTIKSFVIFNVCTFNFLLVFIPCGMLTWIWVPSIFLLLQKKQLPDTAAMLSFKRLNHTISYLRPITKISLLISPFVERVENFGHTFLMNSPTSALRRFFLKQRMNHVQFYFGWRMIDCLYRKSQPIRFD